MAIQYVGGQTASITVVSPTTQTIIYSLTGGLASVPAAGDLVIVGYGEAAGGDAVLSGRISTSGYSLITELYSNDSQDSNLAVFRKFMGDTPDSNISVIGSTSTNSAVTVNIQVWRGVDTTTPLDPTTTTATGINTGYANPAAITPAAAGNVIALFANTATSNNDSSTYSTASTSYMTNFRQVARAGNSYRSIGGSGYVTGQSAGVSYDPAAWTVLSDSVGYSWCAATLALRPAPEPIALTPNSITTAAPSVGTSALAQIHATNANAITAGQPSVGTSALAQIHGVTAISFATGMPIVSASSLAQIHGLNAGGITTGAPVVGSASTSGAIDLTADSLVCGNPTIGAATLAQSHGILPNGITTGHPSIGIAAVAQDHDLAAVNITTASPIVANSSAQVIVNISANGIATGQPVVGSSPAAQVSILGAQNIITGAPQIGISFCVVNFGLSAASITSGNPTIGNAFINGSMRRDQSPSVAFGNAAVVTGGSNYSIVTKNTPNSVTVTRSNEAA